jgi:thiamine kinase-like enzyme
MNTVLRYLRKNWERLELDFFGSPEHLSCVLMTPRFKASSHVICFILNERYCDPILVAKVPRLAGDNGRLDCEVYNLQKLHSAQLRDYNSKPRVVAYEDWLGNRLLIETALEGQPMKPAFVRRHLKPSIEIVMDWLIELHQDTFQTNDETGNWFERLALEPLNHLELALSSVHSAEDWVLKVRKLIEPLCFFNFPLVFEHGDLSSPNILINQNSKLGVVDWELAEPEGLPAVDLFFFLTYIAFAREKARTSHAYLAAFRKSFFGRSAWARPYVIRYCEKLELAPETVKPLFMLCWLRYVANLVVRLKNFDDSNAKLSEQTTAWLLLNRYYILFQYTIEHMNELYLN